MFAIGSIIAVQDCKYMVCGHRLIDHDGAMGIGYLLVPYPLGFMDVDSFSLVSADKGYPAVYEGYRNDDAEALDAMLEKARETGREVSLDEVIAATDAFVSELKADLAVIKSEEA